MNVALLVCEDTPAYDQLFRTLLDQVPAGAGITLHPYETYRGALPDTVHDHEGYIITGSYAGVYESCPWIPPLLEFVRAAHVSAIPMVGVCFGHQVLAQALGGQVEKAASGWGLGVCSTERSGQYPWMDGNGSLHLIYVHQDQIISPPPGAAIFLRTDHCPLAGFILGESPDNATVMGVQGHPEFNPATAEAIIRSQPEKFTPEVAGPALKTLDEARRGAAGDTARRAADGDTGEERREHHGTARDDSALLPDAITLARWIANFLTEARGPEIERLARAVRYRTVAAGAPSGNAVFNQFEEFLRESFPHLHKTATAERLGNPGLLFTWPGTEPAEEPLLFLAHYDVVPAEAEGWRHPPFSGTVAEGCVWGRGTLDDKGPLMALLEAAERLIRHEYRPRRTIVIALGGDEETGGAGGAVRMAGELALRGITAHATFDEGSVVAIGMIPLTDRPLALIGTAEKGYLDVRLTAEGSGGHAAMPGRHTALGRVAGAVIRITRRGFRPCMPRATAAFLRRLGMRGGNGGPGHATAFLLRHPRLFAPLLIRALQASPTSDALVRTTVAPTMAKGSTAPNVLPSRAEITLNLRLLPGLNVQNALARLRALTDVTVEELPAGSDPVADSPADSEIYSVLEKVTAAHFPAAIVTPFLVTVTTDSRHYRALSRAIYRFAPLPLDRDLLSTIHGVNERIPIRDYRRAISWYYELIHSAGEGAGGE